MKGLLGRHVNTNCWTFGPQHCFWLSSSFRSPRACPPDSGNNGDQETAEMALPAIPDPKDPPHPGRNSRQKPPPAGRPSSCDSRRHKKENHTRLEVLFNQELVFSKGDDSKGGSGGLGSISVVLFGNNVEGEMMWRGGGECGGLLAEEEKWRFQAEVLRAECNLLRMEKEVAVRKQERSRVYLERTLRSAIKALISGGRRSVKKRTWPELQIESISKIFL